MSESSRSQIRSYIKAQYKLPDERLEELLPTFINTLVGHIANLEKAMADGGLSGIGRTAHTLKGALLNLGLHDLAELAREIEQNGKGAVVEFDYDAVMVHLKQSVEDVAGS
ncbi:MAG: Hpt domain-containing protein [Thermodesulfobacteriota bacterium]